MSWTLAYTKQADKDAALAAKAGLRPRIEALLAVLRRDPLGVPPPLKKLVGDLSGAYSRRINLQHRLVYQILQQQRVVKILRLWTHYGD